MERMIPAASRPWTFRLRVLIVAGLAAAALLVARSTLARRADAAGRQALQADLKRLDAAQRDWEARSGRFALSIGPDGSDSILSFRPSEGVVLSFMSHSPDAWSAVAEAESAAITAPRHCGVFRGVGAAPHRALVREGEISCW